MSGIIHFVAGVCVVFGAIGLFASTFTEESDGSKLVAHALRAVGFIVLAGVLNGYT